MSSKHNHSHSHCHPKLKGKRLLITILLNTVITVMQLIGGVMSGSLALLSDALHNFTDVLSLIVSYISERLIRKEASYGKTFGYKRAGIIAALINSTTLVLLSIYLIIESIKKFSHTEPIQSDIVIWLALLGILANGYSVLLIKKDADNSLNIRSAYLHLLSDMLASVAVLIGGLLMKFFQLYWIDSLLTFLIASYLIVLGYDLIKKSVKVLMLFTPEHIDVDKIVSSINKLDGVKKLHHIHVWALNDDELHLEAHLDCESNLDLNEFDILLEQITTILDKDFNINHVTIQPEFNKDDPKDIIVQD